MEGEPLMDFVTVVQVISSEFHFSWVGDKKGDEGVKGQRGEVGVNSSVR